MSGVNNHWCLSTVKTKWETYTSTPHTPSHTHNTEMHKPPLCSGRVRRGQWRDKTFIVTNSNETTTGALSIKPPRVLKLPACQAVMTHVSTKTTKPGVL